MITDSTKRNIEYLPDIAFPEEVRDSHTVFRHGNLMFEDCGNNSGRELHVYALKEDKIVQYVADFNLGELIQLLWWLEDHDYPVRLHESRR